VLIFRTLIKLLLLGKIKLPYPLHVEVIKPNKDVEPIEYGFGGRGL